MIKKWRYGWMFPLVLAVVLGGLSAWLDRISEITIEETQLNPHEPQYTMKTIIGKRFDEQGLLQEQLTSKQAWQLPNSDEVVFQNPDLQLFKQGEQIYHVQSQEARYNTQSRQVEFENDVLLTKAADANRPAGIVQTSRLTVNTVTEQAFSDAPVNYRYGESHGTAGGFTYDHQQGLLNLPSRVKAIIYDPKKTSASQ